jgi:hypothetical protein
MVSNPKLAMPTRSDSLLFTIMEILTMLKIARAKSDEGLRRAP